jgi:hypothetical protein
MPSRNSREPGYKASADYVANVMRAAGYDVTIQTYKFDYSAYAVSKPSRDQSVGLPSHGWPSTPR